MAFSNYCYRVMPTRQGMGLDADELPVMIPVWRYHIRVVLYRKLDVFAEYILRLLGAGETDVSRIAKTLCLNVELVRHIINEPLQKYFQLGRLTQEGKDYLKDGRDKNIEEEQKSLYLLQSVLSKELLYVAESEEKWSEVNENDGIYSLNVGFRGNRQALTVFPIEWDAAAPPIEILEKIDAEHFLPVQIIHGGNVFEDYEVLGIGPNPEPYYLLTYLRRPQSQNPNLSWVALSPFEEQIDGHTTELLQNLQEKVPSFAAKLNNFFPGNAQVRVRDDVRTAVSYLSQLSYWEILPPVCKENLIDYKENTNYIEQAKHNNMPYQAKLKNSFSTMRRILEDVIFELNKKFPIELNGVCYAIRKHNTDDGWCENFIMTAMKKFSQTIPENASYCVDKKDLIYGEEIHIRYKIQSGVLLSLMAANASPIHPFRSLMMADVNFISEFIGVIHSLNAGVHDSIVGDEDAKKIEAFIFKKLNSVITVAYEKRKV